MTELHCLHILALFGAALAGLAIAHRAVLQLPIGLPRLLIILPLLPIFFILPWTIPIYHLRAILSFIFLWTVPSKLLLLCWDAGIDYPSSGFLYFATIVMLPIRVNGKKAHTKRQEAKTQFWWQFLAVVVILNIYSYRNGLPIGVIYVLYAFHIYLGLELMLGGLAKLASACFGVESDPQFNNPFLSTSLSEFWGRRWNLVVTTILRSTVYNPALLLIMRAEKHNAYYSKVQGAASTTRDTGLDVQVAQKSLPSQGSTDAPTNCIKSASNLHGSLTAHTDSDDIIHCGENELFRSSSWLLEGNISDIKALQTTKSSTVNCCFPVQKDSASTVSMESSTLHMHETDKSLHPNSRSVHEGAENEMQGLVTMLKLRAITILFRAYGHNSTPKDAHLNGQTPEICCRNEDSNIRDTFNPMLKARPAVRANPKSDLNLENPMSDASGNSKSDLNRRGNAIETPNLKHAHKISRDEAGNTGGEKPSMRARAAAILATFVVSGLVHELIFYYINKSRATGEVTAFFILHGCATAVETLLRKTLFAGVRLPRPISIGLTLTFLYLTSAWLFMPPLTRYGADINTIAEYQRLQNALLSLFTSPTTSSF